MTPPLTITCTSPRKRHLPPVAAECACEALGAWAVANHPVGGWVVAHASERRVLWYGETKTACSWAVEELHRRGLGNWNPDPFPTKAPPELAAAVDALDAEGRLGERAAWCVAAAGRRHEKCAAAVARYREALLSVSPAQPFTPAERLRTQAEALAELAPVVSRDQTRDSLTSPWYEAPTRMAATDGHRAALVPLSEEGPAGRHVYQRQASPPSLNFGGLDRPQGHRVEMSADGLRSLCALAKAIAKCHNIQCGDVRAQLSIVGASGLSPAPAAAVVHYREGCMLHETTPTMSDDTIHAQLNPLYILAALPSTGTVRVSIKDENSPIYVEHEDGALHVVMPMRTPACRPVVPPGEEP